MNRRSRSRVADALCSLCQRDGWLPAILATLLLLCSYPAHAADPSGLAGLDTLYPSLDALYIDLHQTPELSYHEEKTAAKMAAQLHALGFEVTEHVGGYGVVGVLRNGAGPVVLVRTDMDARGLPSFELLQRRITVADAGSIAALARSSPGVFFAFDLLYFDGYRSEE